VRAGVSPHSSPMGRCFFRADFTGAPGFQHRNCTTPRPEASRSPEARIRHVPDRRQQCSGTATSWWRPGENDNTQNFSYLSSAELQPCNGQIGISRSLNTPRLLHTARLLARGQVLIIAGSRFGSIASLELYDAAKGTFNNTASLSTRRQGHESALLTNRQVLAVGGYENQLGSYRGYLARAELFHDVPTSFSRSGALVGCDGCSSVMACSQNHL
jgi:hypothetical protein